MPTIIALDVSLSMTRAIPIAINGVNDENNITYSQLAIQGINAFLNYLTKNSKLEYVSLVSKISNKMGSHHQPNRCNVQTNLLIASAVYFLPMNFEAGKCYI